MNKMSEMFNELLNDFMGNNVIPSRAKSGKIIEGKVVKESKDETKKSDVQESDIQEQVPEPSDGNDFGDMLNSFMGENVIVSQAVKGKMVDGKVVDSVEDAGLKNPDDHPDGAQDDPKAKTSGSAGASDIKPGHQKDSTPKPSDGTDGEAQDDPKKDDGTTMGAGATESADAPAPAGDGTGQDAKSAAADAAAPNTVTTDTPKGNGTDVEVVVNAEQEGKNDEVKLKDEGDKVADTPASAEESKTYRKKMCKGCNKHADKCACESNMSKNIDALTEKKEEADNKKAMSLLRKIHKTTSVQDLEDTMDKIEKSGIKAELNADQVTALKSAYDRRKARIELGQIEVEAEYADDEVAAEEEELVDVDLPANDDIEPETDAEVSGDEENDEEIVDEAKGNYESLEKALDKALAAVIEHADGLSTDDRKEFFVTIAKRLSDKEWYSGPKK